MTPLYVALEGPHGAGKSSLTDALAIALAAEGLIARAHHHYGMGDNRTPWQRSLHYAQQRAALVAGIDRYPNAPSVVVCDRWTMSTRVEALSAADRRSCAPYLALADAEDQALPQVRYIILDAPPHVLAERIADRGEPIDPRANKIRAHYLACAKDDGWPVVDTSRVREYVLAELVEIVRGWL